MRKQHTPSERVTLGAKDGRKLEQQQSFRDAIVGSLIVVILFSVLWAMLSTTINRIYPWMTVLLGILVGLVVRRAGRGVDWRFPTLAAAMTVLGSIAGNVVASTFEVLRAVTAMTWPVFFSEALSAADIVFALFGAGVAAFYANRRLSRAEYHALRKWQEAEAGGE